MVSSIDYFSTYFHTLDKPGTSFHYTNVPPILVGMLLEKVTGKTIEELVQEYLCTDRYCFTFTPKMLGEMGKNQIGHIIRLDGSPREYGLGFDLAGNVLVMNAYLGHQIRMNFQNCSVIVLLKNAIFTDPVQEPEQRNASADLRKLARQEFGFT